MSSTSMQTYNTQTITPTTHLTDLSQVTLGVGSPDSFFSLANFVATLERHILVTHGSRHLQYKQVSKFTQPHDVVSTFEKSLTSLVLGGDPKRRFPCSLYIDGDTLKVISLFPNLTFLHLESCGISGDLQDLVKLQVLHLISFQHYRSSSSKRFGETLKIPPPLLELIASGRSRYYRTRVSLEDCTQLGYLEIPDEVEPGYDETPKHKHRHGYFLKLVLPQATCLKIVKFNCAVIIEKFENPIANPIVNPFANVKEVSVDWRAIEYMAECRLIPQDTMYDTSDTMDDTSDTMDETPKKCFILNLSDFKCFKKLCVTNFSCKDYCLFIKVSTENPRVITVKSILENDSTTAETQEIEINDRKPTTRQIMRSDTPWVNLELYTFKKPSPHPELILNCFNRTK
jgi:hypothetical protein